MQYIIQKTLDSLSIGTAIEYGPMAMYPLLNRGDQPYQTRPKYACLEEVLRSEKVVIREVNGSGSVPELLFQNYSEWDVLLVEGDHLVGAKQNRTLNTTILAPAHEELIIPVSCVERVVGQTVRVSLVTQMTFNFPRGDVAKLIRCQIR